MLQLHKIIRASQTVAFPIVFSLCYSRDWSGGGFKFMKNDHFLIPLSVLTFSPSFWTG